MKKISSLLIIVLASLSVYCTVYTAENRIVFEDGDLVVYAPPAPPEEIQRFEKPFDPSVSADEITPEIARQLLEGKIKKYTPEENERTKLLEILFWHIPFQYKAEILNWEFELNEDGKISKIQSSTQEIKTAAWPLDFSYRALPILLIFWMFFPSKEKFSIREFLSYCIFIIVFILIIVLISKLSKVNPFVGILFPMGAGIISAIVFRKEANALLIVLVGIYIFFKIYICGLKNSATVEYIGMIIIMLIVFFFARHFYDKMSAKKEQALSIKKTPAQ